MERGRDESDSDSESEKTPPHKKSRMRLSNQKWKSTYAQTYPCLVKSKVSDNHARCVVCVTDFSVSHGGMSDATKHVTSQKHKKLAAEKKSAQLTSFFQPKQKADEDLKSIEAETLMTNFLVEHNVPLSAADIRVLFYSPCAKFKQKE